MTLSLCPVLRAGGRAYPTRSRCCLHSLQTTGWSPQEPATSYQFLREQRCDQEEDATKTGFMTLVSSEQLHSRTP